MLSPQRASIQPATLPAPIGGIHSIASLAAMQPTDAIYTKNIDATVRGLKVRPGYSEYANGFGGDQVKTLIPFEGTAEDGTKDRLFAATSAGVYDISSSTTTPASEFTWAVSTTDAGWCSFTSFTNDAGDRFLLLCDLENGYRIYTESTDTWSTPTITGVAAGDLIYVMVWKNRVWFIERDTNDAWYTDVGVYSGTVTRFNFGSKFHYGGYLKSLHSWTLDSGVGPDDYLVALSSAGDVIVYAGTNPTSPSTFGQIGAFFIGKVPEGRRVALPVGGDLYLLSSYGIISAKDLLAGQNPFTFEGSVSYKINRELNQAVAADIDSDGWELQLLPDLSRIILTTPKRTNQPHNQYVYDINLKAWGFWQGIPMMTVRTWKNQVYCAESLKVYQVTGNVDNVLLAGGSSSPISWSFLTAYNELETPQICKIVEFIRPRFISGKQPTYSVKSFYDYDLTNIAAASGSVDTEAVWDTATWDNALWGGSQDSFQKLSGTTGIGRTVAVAMSGLSSTETTLIDMGVLYRIANNSRGML